MSEIGKGVPEDEWMQKFKEEAVKYFRKAAEQGHANAIITSPKSKTHSLFLSWYFDMFWTGLTCNSSFEPYDTLNPLTVAPLDSG